MKSKKKLSRCVCYVALGCLMLLSGCAKAPLDNKIEGMWRLESFTTHADGTVHTDCDRLFVSIQLWVVELAERQCVHGYGDFVGRFAYEDGKRTVVMKDFRARRDAIDTGDDATPVAVEKLVPYGINSLETRFEVLKVDGKSLVLDSDYATLRLMRF